MNILLSFAQFEREIISERTRDKIAAARRKGKFAGGKPVLGYDLLSSPAGPKLQVNEQEAERIRAMFALYLKYEALMPTVTELNRRDWRTKLFQTRAGKTVGGRTWAKSELFKLLTNVVYIGKVRYKTEVHPGEHQAIVDESVWQRVQAVLQRNGRTGGALVRNKYGALLKGILNCGPCNCSMGHAYTVSGSRRYRYYVCINAQKRGWHTCPSKSIPAGEIERFVVEQIKQIGTDPQILAHTIRQVRGQTQSCLKELQAEERSLQRILNGHHATLRMAAGKDASGRNAQLLAEIHNSIRSGEQRLTELRQEVLRLKAEQVDPQQITAALQTFDPLWQTLSPREQARIVRLLVERVDYDGKQQAVSITFRPAGIRELANQTMEVAA